MPFQKGPCGEGGRMRGFLLPLLVVVVVDGLVLFLLIYKKKKGGVCFFDPVFFKFLEQHQNKRDVYVKCRRWSHRPFHMCAAALLWKKKMSTLIRTTVSKMLRSVAFIGL